MRTNDILLSAVIQKCDIPGRMKNIIKSTEIILNYFTWLESCNTLLLWHLIFIFGLINFMYRACILLIFTDTLHQYNKRKYVTTKYIFISIKKYNKTFFWFNYQK